VLSLEELDEVEDKEDDVVDRVAVVATDEPEIPLPQVLGAQAENSYRFIT
jgi:hypothetical protein